MVERVKMNLFVFLTRLRLRFLKVFLFLQFQWLLGSVLDCTFAHAKLPIVITSNQSTRFRKMREKRL